MKKLVITEDSGEPIATPGVFVEVATKTEVCGGQDMAAGLRISSSRC
jgi:hypothetical protein